MKTFIIIIPAILLVAEFFPSVTCADRESIRMIMKHCMTDIGITNEDFKNMKTINYEDPKIKCLFTCMLTKTGIIVDGKVPLEKIKENLAKKKNMNESRKENIIACVELANQQTDCDVGGTIAECYKEKGVTKGKSPSGNKNETNEVDLFSLL